MDKQDNKANQGNPNNDAYWQSRGYEKRPKNWKKKLAHQPKTKRAKRRDNRWEPDGGITWPLCVDDY